MYPCTYYNLFPPFPRDKRVFVAMPFSEKFTDRWEKVIKPAVEAVSLPDSPGDKLEAYRVDKRSVSDSIITEIIAGIGNCRLFFADVSTVEYLMKGRPKKKHPIRNENVLYEVGIAHSRRLAEEVVLFRSDNDRLMFDLANVRVNHYDPEGDPEGAFFLVKEALESAINEINLQRHLSVQQAVDSLTHDCIQYLLDLGIKDNKLKVYRGFSGSYVAAGVSMRSNSVHHLINLGILSIEYPKLESGILKEGDEKKWKYVITPFGKIVTRIVADKFELKCSFDHQI